MSNTLKKKRGIRLVSLSHSSFCGQARRRAVSGRREIFRMTGVVTLPKERDLPEGRGGRERVPGRGSV
ncbi:MAG: hypothetical protein HGB34_00210 [Candidatus Moranbacteria bacterium]|nr:hypothetical protein [Candidatus Moranbacteria bacterium]